MLNTDDPEGWLATAAVSWLETMGPDVIPGRMNVSLRFVMGRASEVALCKEVAPLSRLVNMGSNVVPR